MFYFDTIFITPLIIAEKTSDKIEDFMSTCQNNVLAVSHWTLAEFASIVSRQVRMNALKKFYTLDRNLIRASEILNISASGIDL